MRSLRLFFPILLLDLLLMTACKQPLGGRCQTDADCEEGECSTSSPKTCRPIGSGGSTIDAGTPDAPPDATLDEADAMEDEFDAALEIDADIPDAEPAPPDAS